MIVSGWRRACPDSCNQGKESDEDEEEEVQWNTLPSDKATDLRDLESVRSLLSSSRSPLIGTC